MRANADNGGATTNEKQWHTMNEYEMEYVYTKARGEPMCILWVSQR